MAMRRGRAVRVVGPGVPGRWPYLKPMRTTRIRAPSRYQRYAVLTWMPCACAHTVRFTLQAYYLEHVFAV